MLFFKQHPRLTYLGIGVLLGVLSVLLTAHQYTEEIERVEEIRKTQLLEKQQIISKLEERYTRLESEHRKMKSHVHITERTNADGSKERIYDSKKSVESERTVVEQQIKIQELNHQRQIELMEYSHKLKEVERSRPSLLMGVSIDTSLTKSAFFHYQVYRPFTIGGWGTEKGEFGLSIGLML